jgi:thioredoxin reductase
MPENPDPTAPYDVVVVGGGPGGLAAALVLGRARRRVLLLDAGVPRNARARHVQGFVTRDGTPPAEFRRVAGEQLAAYPSVERAERRVAAVAGGLDAFRATLDDGREVAARRVLLALGLIDELPDLPGFRALWGEAIFQCPFCHGWEVRDRALGFLAPGPEHLEFGAFLKTWSDDVVVFTDERFAVPADRRARLAAAGVAIEERPIGGLEAAPGEPGRLAAVTLTDGARVARDVLFARPPQRQQPLVEALGLALDPNGFVRVDPRHETSVPGVFAVGDMASMMQTATNAAATGNLAAAMICHDLALGAPAAQGASR